MVFFLVLLLIWLVLFAWLRRRNARGRHLDWLAAGVLLLLVMGFFWRTLSGDVYQPADGGDLVSFLYPTYRFAAEQVRQGVLPLWNPHLYMGAPFIHDIQAGFLYLPNLLLFLLWPRFAYPVLQWMAVGHLFWAGLGLYVLLRTLRWDGRQVARPAALFGALAFCLSDPFLIHLGNLNLIAVLSWMPWVFAAFVRALDSGRLRWAVLAAFLFALANYAGHAQSSYYIGLALLLFALAEAALWRGPTPAAGESSDHAPTGWEWIAIRQRLWRLRFLVHTFALTVLWSAPILLPAAELVQHTERSAFSYQDTVAFSLAPTQAIGLLTPGFFGHGPALHWSLWARVETPYAGVSTLLLAIGALCLLDHAKRRALWVWAVVGIVGFLTALGIYTIVHGWLAWLLPAFDQFRAPARALILWTFSLAIFAAVGLDQIGFCDSHMKGGRRGSAHPLPDQDGDESQSNWSGYRAFRQIMARGATIWLAVVVPLSFLALLLTQESEILFLRASVAALALVLATMFWLGTWAIISGRWAGWWGAPAFASLMLALLVVDLSAVGAYTDISPQEPTRGFQHPEIVEFLRSDPDLFRIDARTGIDDLWQPDTAALVGLQDISGIANPLSLQKWTRLLEIAGGRDNALYAMLNVKYVIARDGVSLPDGFELAFDAPGELSVYRYLNFHPRAWLVHEAENAADDGTAIFERLRHPDFSPFETVILPAGTNIQTVGGASGADEQATITHYGSNSLNVEVRTDSPAYLVLSELWFPGWRAEVNGQMVDVLEANGALRAVAVPAGTSSVHLWFAPASWRWGLAGFGIGILVAAALLLLDRRSSPSLSSES